MRKPKPESCEDRPAICPPGTVYADFASRTVVVETEAGAVSLDWSTTLAVVREHFALGHFIRLQTTETREETRA